MSKLWKGLWMNLRAMASKGIFGPENAKSAGPEPADFATRYRGEEKMKKESELFDFILPGICEVKK